MASTVLIDRGSGNDQDQDQDQGEYEHEHHAMVPPLNGLRVQPPQLALFDDAPCDEGETMALLRTGDSPLASAAYTATDKPSQHYQRSDEWEVVAALDRVCCGMREPRLVEVVQLRHANYGLRWTQTQHHRNPVVRHGTDEDERKTTRSSTTYRRTPFCIVGPHWWLMAATFTVFLVAALTVTVLTLPQAGPGEAITGVLLSIACLSMYAKVGCSNPGIVEHYDEPLNDTYTYCGECESYRPQGALHCMDCRVCIEDYDHHCPWTGKCIGKRNVKYFYAWLFFLVLAFVYEMIEFTTYMLPPEDQPQGFDSDDDDSFYELHNKLSRAPDGELTIPPSAFRQP